MKFYDTAWFISYDLTGKEPGELKILMRDSTPFPFLEKDDLGFVMYLPKVRKREDGRLEYQGMLFDARDESQLLILWNLFKSSIYYLSLLTLTVNSKAYKGYIDGKDEKLTLASIIMVEDAILNAYMKTFHRNLLAEIIFADATSYINLKPANLIRNEGVRILSSTLSTYKTGMIKGRIATSENEIVRKAVDALKRLERRVIRIFSGLENRLDITRVDETLSRYRIEAFSEIYGLLSNRSSTLPEIPAFLYMNHIGENSIFQEKLRVPSEVEVQDVVDEINRRTGLRINVNYETLRSEASQNYWDWMRKERKMRRILSRYKELGVKTRFREFLFPEYDYAEFLRRRAVHSKTIRRITNRLALYYNLTGEDFRREAGIIDLQEAIQVIASQQQRSDIFQEDTLRYRAQAWSILVDVSLSLKSFAGEVKDIILCLTEVSRKLFQDNRSLGVFAFDNRFYIIKDFEENHNRTVCARIGGIEHGGVTYLADGVRIAAEALRRRYEESKILIVVSDGVPLGYKGADEEAKEEIREAVRSGINVIGIGIDSERVKDYFPIYCIVRSPYELMKKFVDTFFSYSYIM